MTPWRAVVCAVVSLTACFRVNAQVSPEDSITYTRQLIGIEQRLLDDIAVGNTAHYAGVLHPDWFVITEDGSMQTKQEFIAGLRPLPKGYTGSIRLIRPKTVFHGATAVIQYVADEIENVFDNRLHTQYSEMNTYIRADTSWRMIASQIFEIPLLPPAIQVPAEVLRRYEGMYRLTDSVTCTISVANDTLFYQRSGRAKTALLAETENIFFRQADARGRKMFVRDERGNMLMKERRNGQDVIWKRSE